MAGGTPVVFPAIAVCDGIAMGHQGMKYSLVTRDLIADSTECMAIAHQFDALVMVPNCDKNVPGLLMAAARVNVPTVFVSGGPMLAGRVKGHKTSLSSMFEAVGSYAAGTMTEEDVKEYEEHACPTWAPVPVCYCQQHELSDRGAWYGTSGQWNHSGGIFPENQAGKTCRDGCYGNVPQKHPSKRYYDKRGIFKCPDHGYGSRMQHQQYAASSGNRT